MRRSPVLFLSRFSTSILICLVLLVLPPLIDISLAQTDGQTRAEVPLNLSGELQRAVVPHLPPVLAGGHLDVLCLSAQAGSDTSKAKSAVPFYRKKTFLAGAALALLAGALVLIVSSGDDEKDTSTDNELPGFPPPPSPQP